VSLSLALLGGGCAARPPSSALRGRAAPSMTLALRGGGELSLQHPTGNVLVLAFFSSWCPASRAALHALEGIGERHARDGVRVVGVNEDEAEGTLDAYVRDAGLHLPIAVDPRGEAARHFDLPTLPTLLVLDREGIVRYAQAGFHGDAEIDALEREVNAQVALAPKPPAPETVPVPEAEPAAEAEAATEPAPAPEPDTERPVP
jgi:peroxiredoxin